MRKRRNYGRKPRTLWNGRYKPYYVILDLDDVDPDRKKVDDDFMRRWWGFLDEFDEA